ncbi:hypothetical protein AB6A40_006553 [Gnathostoma spinigerum]|uniref:Aminomethyltransferase folate-binding domain-containing protein n=1 Tax=Gnathostoma spinigerum TaxID=75299 RepID=A0ABD6EIP7_9BILA
MSAISCVQLSHRGLLRLTGNDVSSFLQGLLTNDIRKLNNSPIIYALFLNNRGRIVEDLILRRKGACEFLVECDLGSRLELKRKFEMYRMHKQVTIEPADTPIYFINNGEYENAVADPRVVDFGCRLLSEIPPNCCKMSLADYQKRRYEFGIAEGRVETGDQLPLVMNGDIMNGISEDKGCYIGQELTARSLHTLFTRKRVVPFTCKGKVSGNVVDETGKKVGRVIACEGGFGIAILKLSASNLSTEQGPITPYFPKWWPKNLKT